MRNVYGAVFVGFAVLGFASVFNTHSAARGSAGNTNSSPPQQLDAAAAVGTFGVSDVTVRTELVQPGVVRDARLEAPGIETPAAKRSVRSSTRWRSTRVPRSTLARFVLGNGQFRPQPFPTPAGLK